MITLIIPTLNEADHVGSLIDQLLADPPSDLVEILVADGGSQDATRDIVAKAAMADSRVRLIDNPKKLQAAGINVAVLAADPRSEIIIRLDAHAGYPSGYVRQLCAILAKVEADSVVVRLKTEASGCFQKAVAAVSNSRLGTGGAAHRIGGVGRWIDHGHHAAFRRSSFARLGGYDETFAANEDAELDVRLRRAGGKIWFAPELEVAYYPRRTVSALSVQYFRYGVGRARNYLKNREGLRIRQLIPPALIVFLLACALGMALTPFAGLGLLAYFAACLVAGVGFAVLGRDKCLLGAAIALLTMHLCWGSGFLWAMITAPFQRETVTS